MKHERHEDGNEVDDVVETSSEKSDGSSDSSGAPSFIEGSVGSEISEGGHWLVANSFRAFVELLETLKRPVALMLRGSALSSEELPDIEEMIKESKIVSELGFADVNLSLTPELFASIFRMIKSNQLVKSLCLSGVHIDSRTQDNFLSKLREIHSLTSLNISYSGFGDFGAGLLALSLKESTILTTLNLESNGITDSGAKEIAYSLVLNRSLLHLEISQEEITDTGVFWLCDSLILNETIIKFNIYDCNAVTEKGAESMLKVTKAKQDLIEVNITSKRISPYSIALSDIQKATSANETRMLNEYLQTVEYSKVFSWRRSKLMIVGGHKSGKTSTLLSLLHENEKFLHLEKAGINTMEVRCCIKGPWQRREHEGHVRRLISRVASDFLFGPGLVEFKRVNKTNSIRSEPRRPRARELKETSLPRKLPQHKRNIPLNINASSYSLMKKARDRNAVLLSVWDFSGEIAFHTINHLFLTRYGAYLLVFNMIELLNDGGASLEILKFWFHSLSLHAPKAPVILVGTHVDEIQKISVFQNVQRVFQQLELHRFPTIVRARSMPFHSIDNRSGHGLSVLAQLIDLTIINQDHIHLPVSIAWMDILDKMVETNKNWCKTNYVEGLGIEYGLELKEIEEMLLTFHQLGLVMYLTETEAMKDVVILNPHWLLNSFSKVMLNLDVYLIIDEVERIGLRDEVDTLMNKGVASADLLEYLWGKDQTKFLLDMMQNLLLICQWNYDSSDTGYLVPTMLPEALSIKVNDIETVARFEFVFDVLLNGLFELLVCLCMQSSDNKDVVPILSKRVGKIFLEDGKFILVEKLSNKISVRLKDDTNAKWCLELFIALMNKVNRELMNSKLVWELFLQIHDRMIPYKTAQAKGVKPWFQGSDSLKRTSVTTFLKDM